MPIWIIAACCLAWLSLPMTAMTRPSANQAHREMVCSGHWPPEVGGGTIGCSSFVPDVNYAREVR